MIGTAIRVKIGPCRTDGPALESAADHQQRQKWEEDEESSMHVGPDDGQRNQEPEPGAWTLPIGRDHPDRNHQEQESENMRPGVKVKRVRAHG
jgi:hypothetical protein